MCVLKQLSATIQVPLEAEGQDWITIQDSNDKQTILKSYVDGQRRSIIDAVTNSPLTFPEIVSVCNIPQTSCHRKILSMMKEGLIAESNPSSRTGSKRYMNTLKALKIDIEKGKIIVKVKPALNNFRFSN